MFSCDICLIFKNTYFEERLRTTTSIFGINSGNKFEDVKANLNVLPAMVYEEGL